VRARRVPPALLFGHLADDQNPALDLLADQIELRLALLLGALTRCIHDGDR